MHHAIAAHTKRSPSQKVSPIRFSEGSQRWTPTRKAALSAAASRTLARYEKKTRRTLVLPETGTNLVSALARFSCETPARSIIAEIATEFRPTTSGA